MESGRGRREENLSFFGDRRKKVGGGHCVSIFFIFFPSRVLFPLYLRGLSFYSKSTLTSTKVLALLGYSTNTDSSGTFCAQTCQSKRIICLLSCCPRPSERFRRSAARLECVTLSAKRGVTLSALRVVSCTSSSRPHAWPHALVAQGRMPPRGARLECAKASSASKRQAEGPSASAAAACQWGGSRSSRLAPPHTQ